MTDFIRYPKIKLLGHKDNQGILTEGDRITIQEKIDGSNFRFMIKDNKLIFGSRKVNFDGDQAKGWQRCIDYIKKKFEECDGIKLVQHHTENTLVFFGECAKPHTVNYDWEKLPPFLGFDIYDITMKRFFTRGQVEAFYSMLNIEYVPLLFEGRFYKDKGTAFKIISCDKQLVESGFLPKENKYPSLYALDRIAEGVVIKNYDKQIFAKKYSNGYKERMKESFGKSKKHTTSDNELFIETYLTVNAVEKTIFKLIDEGYELDRTMMKALPMRVWHDAWEEEWEDIASKKWTINLGKIKKEMAKRCLIVLDRMITDNALNGSD